MHNPVPDSPADHQPPPLVTGAGRPRPLYVGSDIYRRAAFGSNHPLRIMRHAAVRDLIDILGWMPEGAWRDTEPATPEVLAAFHDPDYLSALEHAEAAGKVTPAVRERYHIGTLENPLFDGLFERAAMTVGGSILAAELAAAGHVVFHPSGGTHHGMPDRAHGFCYFNDPVFAILTFLDQGRERVMYIDLDAHHGDGVEDAFADDARVLTLSLHEADRWPHSGAADDRRGGLARNLPVPKGVNDSEFNYLLEHAILPIADDFAPDALVLCCGADCLAGDPLSGMMLCNVTLWDAVLRLIALGKPTVILGGGGYNPWTVTRYWAGLWGRINGYPVPERLPEQATRYLDAMECDLIDEDDIDPAWLTTLADIPRAGSVRNAVKWLAETATRRG